MQRALSVVRTSLFTALGVSACSSPDDRPETIDLTAAPSTTVTAYTSISARPRPPGGGWIKEANAVVHRASPATCEQAWQPTACAGNEGFLNCKADAECTERPNGKCISAQGQRSTYCACDYACASDADCKRGEVCACSEFTGTHNTCVPAACSTDSDCNAGFCAFSKHFNGCGVDMKMACKTPEDKCKADADCTDMKKCVFTGAGPGKAKWDCQGMTCVVGRPLVVGGAARTAPAVRSSAWVDREATPGCFADHEHALRLREHWLNVAATEHASIASFGRFVLELLALGAPAKLVEAASRAMLEEAEHARFAYGVAREYGAHDEGPGSLPAALERLDPSLEGVVTGLVRDGCAGETLGAVEALVLADHALPSRIAGFQKIAREELSHARLAFDTVRWLHATFGERVRSIARRAFAEVVDALDATPTYPEQVGVSEHGLLGEAEALPTRKAALRGIVGPLLDSLLGDSAGTGAVIACR